MPIQRFSPTAAQAMPQTLTTPRPSPKPTPTSAVQTPDHIERSSDNVSRTAKGIAVDHALPQRYRLRAVTPNLAEKKTSNALLMDTHAGKIDKQSNAPRGMDVIRSDAPHGGTPTHHLNINKRLTNVEDPHLPISPAVYTGVGTMARTLEIASKAALPLAVTIDTARIGNAVMQDDGKIGKHTTAILGNVAGGWSGATAGAWGGAQAGALIGAEIGAPFGPVGALPGAAAGGLVGGIAGGIGGGIAGSQIGERIATHLTKGNTP